MMPSQMKRRRPQPGHRSQDGLLGKPVHLMKQRSCTQQPQGVSGRKVEFAGHAAPSWWQMRHVVLLGAGGALCMSRESSRSWST